MFKTFWQHYHSYDVFTVMWYIFMLAVSMVCDSIRSDCPGAASHQSVALNIYNTVVSPSVVVAMSREREMFYLTTLAMSTLNTKP